MKSQTGKKGTALYVGARRGWVVNATPWQLYPRELPGIHCIQGWVGPKTGPNGCGKYHLHRHSIPRRLQPVARRYTEYATPAHEVSRYISNTGCTSKLYEFIPRFFAETLKTFCGALAAKQLSSVQLNSVVLKRSWLQP